MWLQKSSQLGLPLKDAMVPTTCHPCQFPALVHCETTHMPILPEEKGQCGGGNKEGRWWDSFWQAEELVKLRLEVQQLSQAYLTLNLNGS